MLSRTAGSGFVNTGSVYCVRVSLRSTSYPLLLLPITYVDRRVRQRPLRQVLRGIRSVVPVEVRHLALDRCRLVVREGREVDLRLHERGARAHAEQRASERVREDHGRAQRGLTREEG